MQTHRIGGRNVVDGTKAIQIEITKHDTQLASRQDHGNCAVARACMKQEGTDAIVHISRVFLKMKNKDIWVRYIVKNDLRTEIVSFDRGGNFEPGVFTLYPIQPAQKLGTSHIRASGPRASKRKAPTTLHGVRKLASRGTGTVGNVK